jgi:hypothetical protein
MDNEFPNPHNITDVALDEVYHLYGKAPPTSVIVSVGPGIPNDHDVKVLKKLSRRFSWPNVANIRQWRAMKTPHPAQIHEVVGNGEQYQQDSPDRSDTSGSSSSSSSNSSTIADALEQDHEKRMKERLGKDYPGEHIYYRLAPRLAGDNLSLNDVPLIRVAHADVDAYLGKNKTAVLIEEAAAQFWDGKQAKPTTTEGHEDVILCE